MIDDFDLLLDKLAEAHDRWPSLRFGQLLCNTIDPLPLDCFYWPDGAFLESIETYLENNE
jgi:hypothetical protein